MTPSRPTCACETPAPLLLRECVLVLVTLFTLGAAAPLVLVHMAWRIRTGRHAVAATGYTVAFAAALVVALGALTAAAGFTLAATGLVGIGVVGAWMPAYRTAWMQRDGSCTCTTSARPLGAHPREVVLA